MEKREMIEQAKAQMKAAVTSDKMFLELAKVWGEPLDPLRPYPKVVEVIADVDTTEAGENTYNFDVDEDTKEVYHIDTNSNVTSSKVTPNSVSSVSFVDVLTKEYYVTFTDLLTAKYDVIARKKKTVTRALNADEIKKMVLIADAAVKTANKIVLASGTTKFTYNKLIAMREKIKDYGDNFVLVVGSQIDHDIILWDYDENKYHSLKQALADLNIQIIRVVGSVSVDGASSSILGTNKALLIALNTEAGKPFKFSRKLLDRIELVGGEIVQQRAMIVSPAIMPVGSNRIPSVGVCGFESIAAVCVNSSAVAGFYRGLSWSSES